MQSVLLYEGLVNLVLPVRLKVDDPCVAYELVTLLGDVASEDVLREGLITAAVVGLELAHGADELPYCALVHGKHSYMQRGTGRKVAGNARKDWSVK